MENEAVREPKRVRLESAFESVDVAKPVTIFHVNAQYNADPSPQKVNLSIGAYRTAEGLPWVLPVVRTVEAQMASDPALNHEYLSLDGLKAFTEAANRFLLGESSPAITQNRACGFQTVGGTGAIRLASDFLFKYHHSKTVYTSDPTWSNHDQIFKDAHFTDVRKYRYYKPATRGLDLDGMLDDLMNAPEGSIIILHACAHNPTGVDPTKDEWRQIISVMKDRDLFPLFDIAYQGFATGDPESDGWAVREFVKEGFELFVAQSFSKNFGLYNERVGNLCSVVRSPKIANAVRSQLTLLGRRLWSNCPNHGARIVATAFNNPSLYQEWRDNLSTMSDRIRSMREDLVAALKANGTPGDWSHITRQIGMFSYTGITGKQVDFLTTKYHIYMLATGRINMCGLNPSNLQYVADAIKDAVTTHPEAKTTNDLSTANGLSHHL